MEADLHNLITLLERTFNKGAWHGPSVLETLETVSGKQAFNRVAGTHSIIELVAHMTAWRRYILKKLAGNHAFKMTEELNFPSPMDWSMTVRELEETQHQLVAAFRSLPASQLYEQVAWTEQPFTYYTIFHGIIHHDLYHIGQINLIIKATQEQSF